MKTKFKGLKTILLSLFVMAMWGSLYPFVKIGYIAFEIDGTDIPSILMFAGVRFAICGLIKFSVFKIVGAVIGFLGIVAINFNPNGITLLKSKR